MDAIKKPELSLLASGNSLKTLQVSALAGMFMPLHHSTQETVIVVQEGIAQLNMPTEKHILEKGTAIIIPAGVDHSLHIEQDFKAIAIMAIDATIAFKKN